MNIEELARQAIERINSMSLKELEEKFIEHGYIPVRHKSCVSYDKVNSQDNIPVPVLEIRHFPAHKIISINKPNYYTLDNCDMDIAA